MSKITSYQDLRVWQEAMDLVEAIYQMTEQMPTAEKYGMTQQMRRAAVSIPANIAEGHGSSHRKVYLNHLSIAKGSLMELETYLILTRRLKLLKGENVQTIPNRLQRVGRQLSGLIRALKQKPQPRGPSP